MTYLGDQLDRASLLHINKSCGCTNKLGNGSLIGQNISKDKMGIIASLNI